MAYQFTDRGDMVGKKPRQIYWTELQDAANENANKIGNLAGVKISVGTTEPTDTVFWLDTSED